MKDLIALARSCQRDLAALCIPWGKVRNWSVNTKAKTRWGLCMKVSRGVFDIQIAASLLEDAIDDQAAKDTVVHELLHTVPGCFKHTGKWKQYAELINKLIPHYSIKSCSSYADKGVEDLRGAPAYRYILKCEQCGREVRRQKKSAVIVHPEYYCCKYGGKLKRIV